MRPAGVATDSRQRRITSYQKRTRQRNTDDMRTTFILTLLLPLMLTACSSSKETDESAAKSDGGEEMISSNAKRGSETESMTSDEDRRLVDASLSDAPTDPNAPVATHTAVIETTLGSIEVELYGLDAPMTVKNFVGLAGQDYFDGILFHRIVPGFVIQGGDPQTKDPAKRAMWGTGGTSIYGGKFRDELNPAAPSYKRGYVRGAMAMANSGPNTNGSQFFIMLQNSGLPKNYSIFGYVTKGMDVVDKIVANGAGAPPANPVAITDVTTKQLREIPE